MAYSLLAVMGENKMAISHGPNYHHEKDRKRRAGKACTNCRGRKTKCEFSSPEKAGKESCIRCSREGLECVIVPSRRGRRTPSFFHNSKRPTKIVQQGYDKPGAEIGDNDSELEFPSGPSPIDQPLLVNATLEAPLRNPSDAMGILAKADGSKTVSGENSSNDNKIKSDISSFHTRHPSKPPPVPISPPSLPIDTSSIKQTNALVKGNKFWSNIGPTSPPPDTSPTGSDSKLGSFCLIANGIINLTQLRTFVSIYFARHHHYLPLIPESQIPINDHLLGKFAEQEPFLLGSIVIIASRYESIQVHVASWKYLTTLLDDILFGFQPTVGVVEGLILLSENIPFQASPNACSVLSPHEIQGDIHHREMLMSWNLVGLAVRFGYFLGLDQNTMLTSDQQLDEKTSRERLAWTYCYFHDRQVSIRLGKAFWSRGPGLNFQTPPDVKGNLAIETLINIPDETLGNTSLVQLYVELTQILANVHDTLYPSRQRTVILMQIGEYYRILDDFTRIFTNFWLTWQNKRWYQFPMNEIVWASFHYVKLYAYSFAFQAHLQRATLNGKYRHGLDQETLSNVIFPRGLTGAPDAKFILEAIKSASDLLDICVNNLHAEGALAYLPGRFYGYFSHAAVFLIKVAFTGAVVENERKRIIALVRSVISSLQTFSSEVYQHHPGVRSARQLSALLNTLTTNSKSECPELDVPAVDPADSDLRELMALLSSDIDSKMWLSFIE